MGGSTLFLARPATTSGSSRFSPNFHSSLNAIAITFGPAPGVAMRLFVSRKRLVHSWPLALIVIALVASSLPRAEANPAELRQAQPTLTIDPSSLVIKVGQNASARVTLLGSPTVYGMVCFSLEGLPASGFITSMDPECVSSEPSKAVNSTLIVEATPAAAPQSFSVFVVASSATWSERAQLGITVVPALPAWIPWTMIVAFILVFIGSVLVGKKRTKDSSR